MICASNSEVGRCFTLMAAVALLYSDAFNDMCKNILLWLVLLITYAIDYTFTREIINK